MWAAAEVAEAAPVQGILHPAQTIQKKLEASVAGDFVVSPGRQHTGCSAPHARDPPSLTRPVAHSQGASPSSCPPFYPATAPHRPVGGRGIQRLKGRLMAAHLARLLQVTALHQPVLVATRLAAAATAGAP